MTLHIVLFKPPAFLTDADRRAIVAAFARAKDEIPTVRRVRIGRRVRHGAGYEAAAPEIEYAIVFEFDDFAGLQAYLRHPAHEPLGELFGRFLEGSGRGNAAQGLGPTDDGAALVYDIEEGTLEDLLAGVPGDEH